MSELGVFFIGGFCGVSLAAGVFYFFLVRPMDVALRRWEEESLRASREAVRFLWPAEKKEEKERKKEVGHG